MTYMQLVYSIIFLAASPMALANPYLSDTSFDGDFFLFSGFVYALCFVFALSGLAGLFEEKNRAQSLKNLCIGIAGISIVYYCAEWVEIVGWLVILVFLIWVFIVSKRKVK